MIYFPHPCLASYYTTNLIRNNPIFKKSRGVFFLSNFCFQNEKNITGTIGSYTSKAAGDAPITVSKVLRCTSHCVKGPDMHLSLCQRSWHAPLTVSKVYWYTSHRAKRSCDTPVIEFKNQWLRPTKEKASKNLKIPLPPVPEDCLKL